MSALFYSLWSLLAMWSIFRLLLYKREPSSTIAWLFFVITVPIVGAVLFLIFGPEHLERKAVRRKKYIESMLADSEPASNNTAENSNKNHPLPPEDTEVLKLAKQLSEYGVTLGNQVKILNNPDQTLTAMQEAIVSAKHFIHLEYYIIASDEVTKQLFDHLADAAERGVEIRILYDALGSLSLKRIYFRKLTEKGVKIAGFLPFSLIPQRLNFNFRNHRKILIIDGTIAFTGGTNIGKEYLGKSHERQWRDFSVQVQGPVCRQLQDVFARDWHFTTQEDIFQTKYYPPSSKMGDSVVQVLESGPDTAFRTLHQSIFLAINSAQKEVLLTTPYFIPDYAVSTSLTVAALRGIKVKLLLPAKTDAKLVQHASRSFYDPLLSAGAEIYEYQPQIIHSKMLIIDNKWTILGSANMDIRSFRHNFELTLFIYGKSFADQARELFQTDLSQSKKVQLKEFLKRPMAAELMENACRLLSPLL